MVVLQTILFLIIVYYIAKILLKWLAPKLLYYAVQKTEKRFQEQFGQFHEDRPPEEREGKTTVHKTRNPKSNPSKKVGEYIDFEEIG